MLQTPDSLVTDSELNIPPPLVLLNEKPKKKFPLWLIIVLLIGFTLSIGTTTFLFLSQPRANQQVAPIIPTVIVTATPAPAMEIIQEGQTLSSPEPTKSRIIPTIYQGKYRNQELQFSLEYPQEWQQSAQGVYVIYEGSGGKMYIGQDTNTDLDIETWFDSTFAEAENAPVKGTLFTNRNGVIILESTVQDEQGPLRYFFITPTNTVASISFTISDNQQSNRALQVIYGKILESIAPVSY